MKTVLRLTAAAVIVGSLAVSTAASAAPFTSGSFGFAAFTSSTTDVTTTTVFPLIPGPTVTVGPTIGGFVGPLATGTVVTLPAGAVDFNLVGCCNWTIPTIGTFIGTVLPVRSQTTPHPNASATWDVVGTYTVGSAFDNAGAVLTANMTWALTQTGAPGDATSISGTFHSPRVTNGAPEPGTLALLGLGLAGLAATRRRKQ